MWVRELCDLIPDALSVGLYVVLAFAVIMFAVAFPTGLAICDTASVRP